MKAIDRHTSDWIKGLAILLMLAHHAFGLPSLIEPPTRLVHLIPGVPIDYWIGRFGKISVAIFLLLSGYGFALRARAGKPVKWTYYLGKAGRFLLAYWPYFLLAWGIGRLFFADLTVPNGNPRFPTDPLDWALNALTLKNTMAFEWWFAETYLLLVLLTLPLLHAARAAPKVLLGGSFAAFVAGAVLDVLKIDPTSLSFANLLIWQLPWVCGILAAKLEAIPLTARPERRKLAALLLGAILLAFAAVELAFPMAMTPFTILAAPAFVWALLLLTVGKRFAGSRVLAFFGKLTLGLWLVHPFVCYYFFQPQLYALQWAPLVFIGLLAASLIVAFPIEFVRQGLERIMSGKRKAKA